MGSNVLHIGQCWGQCLWYHVNGLQCVTHWPMLGPMFVVSCQWAPMCYTLANVGANVCGIMSMGSNVLHIGQCWGQCLWYHVNGIQCVAHWPMLGPMFVVSCQWDPMCCTLANVGA